MSYTEINDRKGLDYGGINEDEIIRRLEVTDEELIADVAGNDDFSTPDLEYNNYARSEIIDWGPDEVYLESDRTARDPSLSKSMINLRYNGTRGSNPDLPRHAELFIGFTGNDRRGVTNDPRMEEVRGQYNTRIMNISSRFQESNDGFIADRPWTSFSFLQGQKDLFRRLQDSTKVFTTEKTNFGTGRNQVMDDVFGLHDRRSTLQNGQEGLWIPEQNQPKGFNARLADVFAYNRGTRNRTSTRALKQQWNSVNDGEMEINMFTPVDPNKSTRPNKHRNATQGTGIDQDHGVEEITPEQKKQILTSLSTVMSLAVKRHTGTDADHQDSDLNMDVQHSVSNPHNTIGHAVKNTNQDQDRTPIILEDESNGLPKSASKLKDAAKAGYKQQGTQNHNALMADIESLLKKMSQPTRVKNAQSKSEASHNFTDTRQTMNGKVAHAFGDQTKLYSQSVDTTVHSAAASKGLEINVYGHAELPKHKLPAVTPQQTLNNERQGRIEGKSDIPRFVGHTSNESTTNNYFGPNQSVTTGHGPVGPKRLRASEHGDTNMNDQISESHSMV